MAKKRVMSKYDYVFDETCYRNISEESVTVPNMVLSMAEIYRKYVVTGDISQLPGKVRPVTFDNGDEFDESFESEEMTDTLLYAQELRTRKQSPAHPAAEDSSQEEREEGEDSSPSSPNPPIESVEGD